MKKALLLSALLFLFHYSFGSNSSGSVRRTCGSMENLQRQQLLNPEIKSTMDQIEWFTKKYVDNSVGQNRPDAPITIPVVFHILYNNPSQNISDAKCQAQISQLNLDFAKLNSDASNVPATWQSLAANTNIQFCLAQRDPNGAATTGIERRSTGTATFVANDAMKNFATGGLNAWPAASYLNIWVANLGGGLLGYAQFPGGPAATDGVVLLYSTVGSMLQPGTFTNYDLGRTATHEVGHWLNLIHIWGDESACAGTDNVGDTPDQGPENSGCPSFPVLDGCSPTSPGVMFMNYMDYVDDACMNMFTSGQSTRMNALFSGGGVRASLLTSLGCQAPVASCGVPTGLLSNSITSSSAALSWTAVPGANTYTLKYKKSSAFSWSIVSTNTNSKTLTNLAASTTYQWMLQAVCAVGGGGSSVQGTFTTSVAPPCGVPSSLSSSQISANGATLAWSGVSGALNYTVQYQVTSSGIWTSTTSTTNSKVVTGLIAGTSYTFQVIANCTAGPGSVSSTASFTTLLSNCTDLNEPNNTYLTSTVIPTNTDISGTIGVSGDADWFTFTTTAPNTKILVVLSNLIKDYDVSLYNSSFAQLGSSIRSGTVNDSIKKNFTTAGTYYLRVFGKSGANNAIQCYNLRVNVSNINFRLADELNGDINPLVQSDMTVFPNPVKDFLNIIYTSPSSQTATFRIYDMVGKTISVVPMQAVEGENKFSLDFSGYQKGIYFIDVVDNGAKITRKIIVD